MTAFAEIIKSISSLLWPILVFYFINEFKSDISTLLSRLKKGKLFGQEIELTNEIVQLHEAVKSTEIVSPISDEKNDIVIKSIIKEAAISPEAALMLLTTEIEKEARLLVGSIGKLNGDNFISITEAFTRVDSHYGLPKYLPSSLKLFLNIRNQIIHGVGVEKVNILSALDSGITILKVLQSMPREIHSVFIPKVDLYADPQCVNLLNDVKGLILISKSSNGINSMKRIFPTTKDYFEKDMVVSWEWSNERAWNTTWYIDPEDNKMKLAWNSSSEFVGQALTVSHKC